MREHSHARHCTLVEVLCMAACCTDPVGHRRRSCSGLAVRIARVGVFSRATVICQSYDTGSCAIRRTL